MLRSSNYAAVAALSLLSSLTVGCASDDEEESSAPCNALENDGPDVTPAFVTEGTIPEGGTIENGTYEQTGLELYPDSGKTLPPNVRTYFAVFDFSAGVLEAIVGQRLGDDEQNARYSATYATSGTTLTLEYTCPGENVERPQFTAKENELRLYYRIADDTGTGEIVLTKR
jgi:hypothetical protein